MRAVLATGLFACLAACLAGADALAQAGNPIPILPPAAMAPPSGSNIRVEWEVKSRFRLFRSEEDFQRHAAAHRGDGILAAERRLQRTTDGRGWARDMVERLCLDATGSPVETCQRDGHRENYISPEDHRIGVVAAGAVPANSTCAWTFEDGEGEAQRTSAPCSEEVRLRPHYGRTTQASVTITQPDGAAMLVATEIVVRDLLIAGLGDSIAAGEGNPDRPVALDDTGFCYRRFLGGTFSEYFRPGRAGFRGSKACDAGTAAGAAGAEWARLNARWISAGCHRSLYGYQLRAALAIAIENPHIAVTFLPLACSGATIDAGFFNAQRVRECPPSGSCPSSAPAQLTKLRDLMTQAQKARSDRALDLILLTVGANDVGFSGLVGDVIVESGTDRSLFGRGGLITSVADAQKTLERDLPKDFARLRGALKPMMGGDLSRVVYVSYGHPAMASASETCPGGRAGFDVHPAFNADPERLGRVADFVGQSFLPAVKELAQCAGNLCKDPANERMAFVDSHQAEFANHGFCARADDDPVFDRDCFSDKGESFESDPAAAATAPLVCNHRPRDFRPYASRKRWIRTANDSYFTAMTYPEGIGATLRPADLHDATWGATSAVYGGAIHPTAEGLAAMADAALPAMRAALELPAAPLVRAEPLAPLQPLAR